MFPFHPSDLFHALTYLASFRHWFEVPLQSRSNFWNSYIPLFHDELYLSCSLSLLFLLRLLSNPESPAFSWLPFHWFIFSLFHLSLSSTPWCQMGKTLSLVPVSWLFIIPQYHRTNPRHGLSFKSAYSSSSIRVMDPLPGYPKAHTLTVARLENLKQRTQLRHTWILTYRN